MAMSVVKRWWIILLAGIVIGALANEGTHYWQRSREVEKVEEFRQREILIAEQEARVNARESDVRRRQAILNVFDKQVAELRRRKKANKDLK